MLMITLPWKLNDCRPVLHDSKLKFWQEEFSACITAFAGNLSYALFELTKTDLECWRCHDRHEFCGYDDLPENVEREYDLPIRPCFEAQETTECQRVLDCIESLQNDAANLSFDCVSRRFSNETAFHFKDSFSFNEQNWDAANECTRKMMLYRAYLSTEKRMSGGCFLCKESHCNAPLRDLRGTDLHHVLDHMKLFNPSEGPNKTVNVSLTENRKLCPLCKKCHMLVHHKVGENERFMKLLGSKYQVDVSTGEISFKAWCNIMQKHLHLRHFTTLHLSWVHHADFNNIKHNMPNSFLNMMYYLTTPSTNGSSAIKQRLIPMRIWWCSNNTIARVLPLILDTTAMMWWWCAAACTKIVAINIDARKARHGLPTTSMKLAWKIGLVIMLWL